MQITREQLAAIAPEITPVTLDILFDLNSDGQPHIVRAMAEAGITRIEDVAQFMAITSLASHGFANFATLDGSRAFVQSPIDWLRDKAKDWFDMQMSDESRVWDWGCIVNHLGVKWDITGYNWPDTWNALGNVCKALGVENRLQEFALT